MKQAAGWAVLIGGIATMLMGVSCLLTGIASGDTTHTSTCIAQIVAGAGVISPGMNLGKVGPFARPGNGSSPTPP